MRKEPEGQLLWVPSETVMSIDGSIVLNDSRASEAGWACPAVHISPQLQWTAAVSARESARAVESMPLEVTCHVGKPPSKRSVIKQFSRASRRRLLFLIAKVAEPILEKALFVTLTYPSHDPATSKHAEHLDALLKRLRRMAPDASCIWKLEYTKADTPHFHLLVFNLNQWAHQHLARSWSEIVKSSHPGHQAAGTRVERINNKRHAARYISKYVGKVGELPEGHQGRCWGKAGNLAMALSPQRLYLLTKDQFVRMRRFLDRCRKAQNRKKVFKRRSEIHQVHRWFANGPDLIRYMSWIKADAVPP